MPTDCEPWPGKTKADVVHRGGAYAPIVLHAGRACATIARTLPFGRMLRAAWPPNLAALRAAAPRRRRARTIARRFEADLSAPVLAAGTRIQNVRQISERVAMGRALWRELVIGFASQLGEMRLGFTQLAALYVLADSGTMTIGDLAEVINRSPSATSRLVDGLVRRRLVERRIEAGGPPPAVAPADPARPGAAPRRRPGPGRPVPVGRPPDADRRAGAHRDGGRGSRDPRHLPPRAIDQVESRTGLSRPVADVRMAAQPPPRRSMDASARNRGNGLPHRPPALGWELG